MANFHPTDDQLVEFSAGNMDWALSIAISAHLQFCPHCKSRIAELNCIGGASLAQTVPAEMSEGSFDQLMNKINAPEASEVKKPQLNENPNAVSDLPKVVQKLLPKNAPLKWSFISPSLKAARLDTGQDKYEVCFHKISKGGRVAEHDHNGLEVTLVLEGSFSDSEGNYMPGDFIIKQPGEVHRPMATQDKDCLCLSVVEAPVKLTGMLGKLINPFLSISPR